jgi:L-fuculose-phosphate aldolase
MATTSSRPRTRKPKQEAATETPAESSSLETGVEPADTPEVSVEIEAAPAVVAADAEVFQWLGRDLYLTGLVSSHTGSLSTRSDSGATITRQRAMLGHLRPEDLIALPIEGNLGDTLPDEAVVHQAIYRGTDTRAVIYARPPATMALALVEDRLSPPDGDGASTFGTAPVLNAQRPLASPDLAQLIARILKENRIVALRGVGVFARGADLPDALHVVSLLEEMCRMTFMYRSLSGSGEDGQPTRRGGLDRQPTPGPYGPRPNGIGGGRGGSGGGRPPRNQGNQGNQGGGWRGDAPRDGGGGPRRSGGLPQQGPRRPPHR